MPSISEIYEKAKDRNILSGILIADLIAFISYLIFPIGIVFFGDLQMIIGVSIGVYFGLTYNKEGYSEMKTGLIVGFFGSLLTAISMALFEWILYITSYIFSIIALLFYITVFIIEALIIGLPISCVFGLYFRKKRKKLNLTGRIDDDFYKSLENN